MTVLIAGIGNIFHGDDAFGVEVARRLAATALPEGVRVVDFGIRSYDLAYALLDGPDAVVLVDAVQRGRPPGTLFLIEPEVDAPGAAEGVVANAHAMDPAGVLRMVRAMGGRPAPLCLVGCEPAVTTPVDGRIGLSPAVERAVPGAVEMIRSLVRRTLEAGDLSAAMH